MFDTVSYKMNRFGASKACGGSGEVARESDDESMIEFVVKLPACADIP
jgi:hypothetical protein